VTSRGEIRHQNYTNDEDLKWSTKVATCATIRLYSTTFDTESSYDYIKIEGTNTVGIHQSTWKFQKTRMYISILMIQLRNLDLYLNGHVVRIQTM